VQAQRTGIFDALLQQARAISFSLTLAYDPQAVDDHIPCGINHPPGNLARDVFDKAHRSLALIEDFDL
jgi:hypothetical protein